MQALSVNDLARWSLWPARLLGLVPWQVPQRNLAKIEAEYNRDKFAKCLDLYENAPPDRKPTPAELELLEFDAPDALIPCSIGEDLVVISAREAMRRYREMLSEVLAGPAEAADTVVELGCGYGSQLWHLARRVPGKAYVGGEYAANAVALSAKLYGDGAGICVRAFNFYAESYAEFFGSLSGRVFVYTAHALSQLPSARHVIDALAEQADRITAVVNIEPMAPLYDDSLLGLMRRRYLEVNDYNRDLLDELRRRTEVEIVQTRPNIFGQNPFCPVSAVEWRFR